MRRAASVILGGTLIATTFPFPVPTFSVINPFRVDTPKLALNILLAHEWIT